MDCFIDRDWPCFKKNLVISKVAAGQSFEKLLANLADCGNIERHAIIAAANSTALRELITCFDATKHKKQIANQGGEHAAGAN